MKWKILPLISLIFLSFIVFVKANDYYICEPPSCFEQVTLYAVSGLCDWRVTVYTNSYNPSSECDSWKYKAGSPPSGYRVVCDWSKGTYSVSGRQYNTKLSYYFCPSDKSCCYYICQDSSCKCYSPPSKTDCSLSSCPSAYIKRVFVGCENKQKIYDVYNIKYELTKGTDGPYCKKVKVYLGKDYQDVECCVDEDCGYGYVCSNYKCVQVEVPTPPTPPEKTCEDYGYISYPPICPPYSRAETITVDGLTCYTGRCIPEEAPPEENVTMPPEENITKPTPPEEKPTEILSIIIWIIIFGAVGYFLYKRFKK